MPHSGLHNQRIALINAALLAFALNRTLIMPELNLGAGTYWRPSKQLPFRLDECVPKSLQSHHTERHWWAPNCFDYKRYIPMPVESIFDLTAFEELGIKTMQRRHMSLDYFARYWSVPQDDRNQSLVYQVPDTTRYSYQIADSPTADRKNIRYQELLTLNDLARHQEPFLLFNSLFGSSRLALSEAKFIEARQFLREQLGVHHPHVLHAAMDIIGRLGGPANYVSAHIRMGDGVFKVMMNDTMEQVRQKLLQHSDDAPLNRSTLHTLTVLRHQPIERLNTCLKLQPPDHHRFGLIYMTTDAPNPRRTLSHLYDEFACLFSLQDFQDVADATQKLRLPIMTNHKSSTTLFSDDDSPAAADTPLTVQGDVFLPMIDAEVASQASYFVPTPKSTFSGYITYRNQRLQRIYNNDIASATT
ncbi:hypothetical protein DM01DRAFT_1335628 [Hesseltinella vesiculosa]|uniref:O-fucosyltransferase family protein n=1 Tax=Hesseltinella vesiculosa TaxID=101127 RepID=A0A1X2GIE6_9FUNG|nr:hypothetical protein DM01DRAFT_1335628 [Hesseltinella vesiculosa]